MAQHLVMIVIETGEASEENVKTWVKNDLTALRGSFPRVSSETIAPLTSPAYTNDESEYIYDMIAEMQEELSKKG